jgi:ribose transport system permease protein
MRAVLTQAGSTALDLAPLVILAVLAAVFGALSPRFLTADNLINILVQSSSAAVVAVGMTFVLLTGGIDLSVGMTMFLGAALCGRLVAAGWPVAAAVAVMLAVGPACGLLHAGCIAGLRMVPFVVTLATQFVFRGSGLWVSQTRAINLPDSLRQVATGRVLGVPVPVLVMAGVVTVFHLVLVRTAFGRHLLAVGHDPEAARKAGVGVRGVLTGAYVACGLCAAVGGLVSLAQLSAVSPTFGRGRELDAIAAAVLGGTSLFGGRGNVFPGAVLGAVLVQTVYNGLNLVNADPYSYPVVTSSIILLAVGLDAWRARRQRPVRRPSLSKSPVRKGGEGHR